MDTALGNSLDFSCKLTFTPRLPTPLELNASENMKTEDRRRMHKVAESNLLVIILLKDMGSLARELSRLALPYNDHISRIGQLFISSN